MGSEPQTVLLVLKMGKEMVENSTCHRFVHFVLQSTHDSCRQRPFLLHLKKKRMALNRRSVKSERRRKRSNEERRRLILHHGVSFFPTLLLAVMLLLYWTIGDTTTAFFMTTTQRRATPAFVTPPLSLESSSSSISISSATAASSSSKRSSSFALYAKKKSPAAAALDKLEGLLDDLVDEPLSLKEQQKLAKKQQEAAKAAAAAAANKNNNGNDHGQPHAQKAGAQAAVVVAVESTTVPPAASSNNKKLSKKEQMLAKALALEGLDEAKVVVIDDATAVDDTTSRLDKKVAKKAAKALNNGKKVLDDDDDNNDDDDSTTMAKPNKKAKSSVKTTSESRQESSSSSSSSEPDEPYDEDVISDPSAPTLEDKIRKERPPPRIRVMESSQPGYTSLRLEGVGITFRNQQVLKDVTWGVQTGDRIGLVGANGAGKTTQLRIMAGEIEPTTGDVVKSSKDLRVAVLRQEFVDELVPTRTLREEMLSVFVKENKILQELKQMELELESKDFNANDADQDALQRVLDRMQELQNQAEDQQVYVLESRVKKVLDVMGFTDDESEDLVASFSGGWKMRIGLGKVLLQDPNILLLDEPTNRKCFVF
jgi:ABC-type Mn2+/Zn2+ transport system ATPase subunit